MLYVDRYMIFAACAWLVCLASDAAAVEPIPSQTAPAPQRLPVTLSYTPRWQPANWIVTPLRQPVQPTFFTPTASNEFRPYESLPELDLDLDFDAQAPQRGKPTVGGWIQVGYQSGRLGQ
jgi:hypothetical protein